MTFLRDFFLKYFFLRKQGRLKTSEMKNISKTIPFINRRVLDYIFLETNFIIFSFSAVFFKKASSFKFYSKDFNWFAILGLVMMFIYALLWQQILKRFTLIVAFSHKVFIYFWILLWSAVFFNEKVTLFNIAGLLIISIGVITVSKSD